MPKTATTERPRRDRSFWAPVWIFIAFCAVFAAYLLGVHVEHGRWLKAENAALAIAAIQSPVDALDKADALLMKETIDFPLYSDLVRKALSQQDARVRNAANLSMARVLDSGRAFAGDLKKELAAMPTQVFIVTSEAGASKGLDFEKKLKSRGEKVEVIRETREPNTKAPGKTRTEVFCFDDDTCKQTALSVTGILREEGVDFEGPTHEEAGARLFNKQVEINFADEKVSEPNNPAPPETGHRVKRVMKKHKG